MKNEDITSQQATDLDLALGTFCLCLHSKKEHSLGKCYGLDFNGTVWQACDCIKLRIQFNIKTKVYESPIKETEESKSDSSSEKALEFKNLFARKI